ncbi:magnesium transporter CorA family protein [Paenibacillus sp. SYP-B4298]|uniref:magnesium transporter CorA family protein n=1 Tax=Paenibacillus sp. SYP-B4298 TaxID=2996034 RepID=UPI0022DDCB79|nr:magnesium transporter CorA family protein [Paenibacillus sp. SYP-B4298]
MTHRKFRYHAGWEWMHSLQASDNSHLTLKKDIPLCARWLDESVLRTTNHIHVTILHGGLPLLQGSLLIQMSDDEQDVQMLHFWVTPEQMITLHSDLRLVLRMQRSPWNERLEQCGSAPEAFMLLLSHVLDTFHEGLDSFEAKLHQLENSMRRRNRADLMDGIFERRYELLHWSQLFVPVLEIEMAAREAFLQHYDATEGFSRLRFKLERIDSLMKHYNQQIDTLISMDDAISNLRGTDVMKTLTIFTALFTPAGVVGALWGMNFQRLPWLRESWGFALVLGITGLLTAGVYFWLWYKGWTGDLLKSGRSSKAAASKHGHGQAGGSGRPGSSDRAHARPSQNDTAPIADGSNHPSDHAADSPSRSSRSRSRS